MRRIYVYKQYTIHNNTQLSLLYVMKRLFFRKVRTNIFAKSNIFSKKRAILLLLRWEQQNNLICHFFCGKNLLILLWKNFSLVFSPEKSRIKFFFCRCNLWYIILHWWTLYPTYLSYQTYFGIKITDEMLIKDDHKV